MRYVWATLIYLALAAAAVAAGSPLPSVATAFSNADLGAYATTDAPNGLQRCGYLTADDSPCLTLRPSNAVCPTTSFVGTVQTSSVPTNQLRVTAVVSGALRPGLVMPSNAAGGLFVAGTIITQQLSGTTGGVGTYQLSQQFSPPPSFQLTVLGDGTASIPAANGGCWLAVQPPPTTNDIRQFGVVFDSTTDNTAALGAAIASAAQGNVITIPAVPGQCARFTTPVAATLASATTTFILEGAGSGSSILCYAGTGTAITITAPAVTNSLLISDLTICTTTAGSATTGLSLTQTGPGSVPQVQSHVEHVVVRGCDGFAQTDYFAGAAIAVSAMSGVHFGTIGLYGNNAVTAGTTGLSFVGTGANAYSLNAVIDTGSVFDQLDKGMTYGQWVQGITIADSSFLSGNTGIYAPAGGDAGGSVLAGLFLSNVLFGTFGPAIDLQSAIDSIMITGGNPQAQANNVHVFNFPFWAGGSIQNVIFTNPGNNTGITYIFIDGGSNLPSTIGGNTFNSAVAATGVSYGAGAGGIIQCANHFGLGSNGLTVPAVFAAGALGTNISFCDNNLQFGSMLTGSTSSPVYLGGGANASELAVGLITKPIGFLHDLYCIFDQAPTAGQTYTFALSIGTTAQPLSCATVPANGATQNACSDVNLSHAVTTPASSSIAILMTPSAGAAVGTHFNCSVRQATP